MLEYIIFLFSYKIYKIDSTDLRCNMSMNLAWYISVRYSDNPDAQYSENWVSVW